MRTLTGAAIGASLVITAMACGGGSAQSFDYQQCAAVMEPFLQKLQAVGSRLDVGLNQPDYNSALGSAKISYDRASVHFAGLSPQCLKAGGDLEDAYNAYISANKRWAECINDQYCDVQTDALTELRVYWRFASRYTQQAVQVLDGMKS